MYYGSKFTVSLPMAIESQNDPYTSPCHCGSFIRHLTFAVLDQFCTPLIHYFSGPSLPTLMLQFLPWGPVCVDVFVKGSTSPALIWWANEILAIAHSALNVLSVMRLYTTYNATCEEKPTQTNEETKKWRGSYQLFCLVFVCLFFKNQNMVMNNFIQISWGRFSTFS